MAIVDCSTDAEVNTAVLNGSPGDIINLEPATPFGKFRFNGLDFGSAGITVTTDPSDPATIIAFSNIGGAGGITVENVHCNPLPSDLPKDAASNQEPDASVFYFENTANCWVRNIRLRGVFDTTVIPPVGVSLQNAGSVYGGIVFRNCDGGGVTESELSGTRYSMLIGTGCDGQLVYGNFIHGWTAGDVLQWGGNSSNLTYEENYVTGYVNPFASGVHPDGLQSSLGPNTNITVRRNFMSHPFTFFGQTAPFGDYMQCFFLPQGGGHLIMEDNVAFNYIGNSYTMSGWQSAEIRNNTLIENNWLAPGQSIPGSNKANFRLTGGTVGPYVVENNLSPRYTLTGSNLTQTNNAVVLDTAYATHFPGVKHDGTEQFDDLRLSPSSPYVAQGVGSIYTRTPGLYPRGYTLARALYAGGSGGGQTRQQLPRNLKFGVV